MRTVMPGRPASPAAQSSRTASLRVTGVPKRACDSFARHASIAAISGVGRVNWTTGVRRGMGVRLV